MEELIENYVVNYSEICEILHYNEDEAEFFFSESPFEIKHQYSSFEALSILKYRLLNATLGLYMTERNLHQVDVEYREIYGEWYVDLFSFISNKTGETVTGIPEMIASSMNSLEMCFKYRGKTFVSYLFFDAVRKFYSRDRPTPIIQSKSKTYLIKDERNGFIKIGKAINPRIRESTLQSEMPLMVLIAICEDDIESLLHKKFYKQRKRGEWFKLSTDQLLDLIKEHGFKLVCNKKHIPN